MHSAETQMCPLGPLNTGMLRTESCERR